MFSWFLQIDLEEAKSQEISKLEAALNKLQAQTQNATELAAQERVLSRQVSAIKETEENVEYNSAKLDKLQAENERLMVISFKLHFVSIFLYFRVDIFSRGTSCLSFSSVFVFC
jgi:uncharacterized membrane protein YdfJ with MMPL/SSD domain